jgi:hypothetical protein
VFIKHDWIGVIPYMVDAGPTLHCRCAQITNGELAGSIEMKKQKFCASRLGIGTLLWAIVAVLLAGGRSVEAQQAVSVIKPAISINEMMVAFVDQAADAIWTAAASPPKKACEWQQVEYHAIQLATSGTLLRVGGTGTLDMQWKDAPRWAPLADKMTDLALAAARAAKTKNVAELKKVGDELILNCEGCHRAFKPEVPTQNILTHLSHAESRSKLLPFDCSDGK